MGELYGEEDPLTMEWKDGLMAMAVRKASSTYDSDHKWIICDGPVDALWIENMNTVLDDNKMLCLANSERIKLSPEIHMVFEVQDLAVASPATVLIFVVLFATAVTSEAIPATVLILVWFVLVGIN